MTFEEFIEEWQGDNESINVKTSGSTGAPKEIKLPKKFVRESALRTNQFFGIKRGSRLHSCISADTIGGKMMAVRADLSNSIFTYEIPSNQPLKDLIRNENLDLVAAVPSQVHFILDNSNSLPKINNLLIGGSPIHLELRKRISKSGLNAFESYGMTETASHIAIRKIAETEIPFTLLPEIKVTINEDGCLCITFKDGTFVQTNDLAEIVSNNEFFIKGRKDDMIISGGKKINPYEIEKRIQKLISSPFLITGIPDEKWGVKEVLIIEGEAIKGNLREKLSKVLDRWEMPKDIIYTDRLPRTSNGKIKRLKTPDSFSVVCKNPSF